MLQKLHLATFFKKVILRLFGHFFLFNLFRQNYFQIRENVANTQYNVILKTIKNVAKAPSTDVFGTFRQIHFHDYLEYFEAFSNNLLLFYNTEHIQNLQNH